MTYRFGRDAWEYPQQSHIPVHVCVDAEGFYGVGSEDTAPIYW